MPNPVLFGRSGGHHHVKPRRSDHKIFDDVYDNYNTQSSSQWDGLRHVCHFQSGLFYNGVKAQEILLDTPETSSRLGIHHAARRGIAGRGVLLDYGRWALKHRPEFDPFERIEITVQELEEVAKEQNVTFEHGDILLVRVGWMGAYLGYSEAQLKELIKDPENPVCAGVKACDETFEWIWNNHFAAVGSDNFPFEAYPPKDWNTSCRK
jgi:hypothetical protein